MEILVIASRGPFGPTAATCLLFPLLLAGPFVLLPLALWSLLRAEATPVWLLVLMAIGTAGLAYFLQPLELPRGATRFWMIWWGTGIGCLVALPLVALRELFRGDWRRRGGTSSGPQD